MEFKVVLVGYNLKLLGKNYLRRSNLKVWMEISSTHVIVTISLDKRKSEVKNSIQYRGDK